MHQARQCLLKTLIRVPQLGSEKNILARHGAGGNTATYPNLVPVDGCGIDVAVPCFESRTDSIGGTIILNLPHAITELRDAVAVVEREFLTITSTSPES